MSGKECVSFKVMLVEDDEGFRRSLSGLLKSRFPSIVLDEAADGAEAMASPCCELSTQQDPPVEEPRRSESSH